MAYSVFLGGSIANRGGQNPLEAARFGAQILHGPNIDNFKDVYKFLSDYNISSKIKNGYIYMEIIRGMYGLPQSGILSTTC